MTDVARDGNLGSYCMIICASWMIDIVDDWILHLVILYSCYAFIVVIAVYSWNQGINIAIMI